MREVRLIEGLNGRGREASSKHAHFVDSSEVKVGNSTKVRDCQRRSGVRKTDTLLYRQPVDEQRRQTVVK